MIGIYGGSFDPVHNGHLHAAEKVIRHLALEKIEFLPCGQHALKGHLYASAEQRLTMLQLAIENNPAFSINKYELLSTQTSYTVNTLHWFREHSPQQPYCFILGMDAFANMEQWHNWQDILKYSNLLLIERPGEALAPESTMQKYLIQHECSHPDKFLASLAGQILQIKLDMLNISSQSIRQALKSGKNAIEWLPETVDQYIKTNELYL